MPRSIRRLAAAASRILPLLAVVLGVGLLAPSEIHAHQRLLRTEPAREATLDSVPGELRLAFTEPVQLTFTRIEVLGPGGAPVPLGELRLAEDSRNVLVVPLAAALRPGGYTVTWATASRDGHPVRGEFGFAIASGAAGLVPEPPADDAPREPLPPPAPHHPPPAPGPAAAFTAESPVYVAIRWVTYVSLLGVLGAVAFGVLVLGLARRRERTAVPELVQAARRGAAGLGLGFAVVLGFAALARLYAQLLAVRGPEQALDTVRIGAMLTATVWGWGWVLQAAAVPVAAAGFLLAWRGVRVGWLLAGAGALALAVTPALSGHAAAMAGGWGAAAIAADTLHVAAAGGWLGSLLVLLLAGLPAAARLGAGRRAAGVAALVRAFSPTALLFAAVLVLTGVFATFLHGGSVSALAASEYGRLLFLKLGIFLLVLAAGAYNFRRVLPALGTEEATHRLRRSAGLELGVGAVVLLVTAVLVATARPYEETEPHARGATPAAELVADTLPLMGPGTVVP